MKTDDLKCFGGVQFLVVSIEPRSSPYTPPDHVVAFILASIPSLRTNNQQASISLTNLPSSSACKLAASLLVRVSAPPSPSILRARSIRSGKRSLKNGALPDKGTKGAASQWNGRLATRDVCWDHFLQCPKHAPLRPGALAVVPTCT